MTVADVAAMLQGMHDLHTLTQCPSVATSPLNRGRILPTYALYSPDTADLSGAVA
jgi:hypothetical protein